MCGTPVYANIYNFLVALLKPEYTVHIYVRVIVNSVLCARIITITLC